MGFNEQIKPFHLGSLQVYFERNEGAKSYMDLLKPGNPRRVMLGMSLQMWSQLCGMNIMMYVPPPPRVQLII